jgi:hypothetical protein
VVSMYYVLNANAKPLGGSILIAGDSSHLKFFDTFNGRVFDYKGTVRERGDRMAINPGGRAVGVCLPEKAVLYWGQNQKAEIPGKYWEIKLTVLPNGSAVRVALEGALSGQTYYLLKPDSPQPEKSVAGTEDLVDAHLSMRHSHRSENASFQDDLRLDIRIRLVTFHSPSFPRPVHVIFDATHAAKRVLEMHAELHINWDSKWKALVEGAPLRGIAGLFRQTAEFGESFALFIFDVLYVTDHLERIDALSLEKLLNGTLLITTPSFHEQLVFQLEGF